jgi:pimeloyl-ACP methyl ester carboxylesterase
MGALQRDGVSLFYEEFSLFYEEAKGAKRPILFVHGWCEHLRALAPSFYFGHVVGSGHFCQLEVPEHVNAMIDRFLMLTEA